MIMKKALTVGIDKYPKYPLLKLDESNRRVAEYLMKLSNKNCRQ
jgi:hypothetical protein